MSACGADKAEEDTQRELIELKCDSVPLEDI